MDLDGARRQVEFGGDLAVRQACGNPGQDFQLTGGQGRADLAGGQAVWLRGVLDGELADEALGGAGREDAVTGGDGPDGGDQVVRLGVLQQEPAGACTQPGVNVLVEVERRQDQHPRRQPGVNNVACFLDTV